MHKSHPAGTSLHHTRFACTRAHMRAYVDTPRKGAEIPQNVRARMLMRLDSIIHIICNVCMQKHHSK